MALTAAGALTLGGGVMLGAGGATACDNGKTDPPANRVDLVNGAYAYYGGDTNGGYIGVSGSGEGYVEAEGSATGGGAITADDGGFVGAGHHSVGTGGFC